MTIIDAHHHLWGGEVADGDYPWMTGPFESLDRPRTVRDLLPHLAASDVAGTVVVQARADLSETRDLLAVAARTPEIRGVVGWADFTAPTIDGELSFSRRISTLRSGAGGELLVGLRHDATSEPDPRWLTLPAVSANIRRAGELGLTFDLEITTREMAAAAELVERLPAVRFVVDHAAKPPIATGWSDAWAAGLDRIAAFPNVWCKISGLVTEADWSDWTVEQLVPYVNHAVSAFGADRALFGTDWPVCELAASYEQVTAAALECLAPLSPADLDAVMYRNAIACYGLGAGQPVEQSN